MEIVRKLYEKLEAIIFTLSILAVFVALIAACAVKKRYEPGETPPADARPEPDDSIPAEVTK